MAKLEGYCPNCPCWFAIPDPQLNAHRLCPRCLSPATKTRDAGQAWMQLANWPLVSQVRRFVAQQLSHR